MLKTLKQQNIRRFELEYRHASSQFPPFRHVSKALLFQPKQVFTLHRVLRSKHFVVTFSHTAVTMTCCLRPNLSLDTLICAPWCRVKLCWPNLASFALSQILWRHRGNFKRPGQWSMSRELQQWLQSGAEKCNKTHGRSSPWSGNTMLRVIQWRSRRGSIKTSLIQIPVSCPWHSAILLP